MSTREDAISLVPPWDSPAQMRLRLVAGVVACALLNALMLMLVHRMTVVTDAMLAEERPRDAHHRAVEALGIRESRALTINWLGFETPTLHQAPLASVDQSFFEIDRGAPDEPTETVAPPQPTDQAQPSTVPEVDLRALMARVRESFDGVRTSLASQLAELAVRLPEARRAQQREASLPKGATPSDKESLPTSRLEPVIVRPGQVVAAQGLEIKTVRPEFTHSTRLLSRPDDMVVRIVFGRTGRVISATMLTSSGVTTVDEPVMNAIYRWRAEGASLQSIPIDPPGTGVEVDFRIDVR
ncbi:MAG: energy transducer TonB [Phycisphaerales bacterium JB043]